MLSNSRVQYLRDIVNGEFPYKKTEEFLPRCFGKGVQQSFLFEITLPHWCFPVNMLHIYGKPFYKNTGGLLLKYDTLHCLGQRKFKLS